MANSKKQTSSAPPEIVALYEKMVASCPQVERKGATMPYTSVNGNMTSFVHPSGAVALRLPAALREAFVADHDTKLFDAYGMIQKEYVLVPAAVLENEQQAADYFAESWAYAQTLKPKKTTS